MKELKSENYVTILGWMITELKLKGNELLIYALIYNFSQAEDQMFIGNLQYLADWCCATKQGVSKNLNNLIKKGYVQKIEIPKDGVSNMIAYSTKFNTPIKQSLIGLYNIYNAKANKANNDIAVNSNSINNIKKENNKKIIKREESKTTRFKFDYINRHSLAEYDEFVNLYHKHCFNLPKIRQLTDKRRKSIQILLDKYTRADIIEVFNRANESDFLTGKNDRGWKADIDFILREDKFLNILEGKYGGKKQKACKEIGVNRHVQSVTEKDKEKFNEFKKELARKGLPTEF